jgi:hypothetical protein
MTTSKKKRKCLLACARKGLTLSAVCRQLEAECLDTIHSQQWNLWENYYLDIVENNPYFEHELIENNRSLAWFTKETNQRRTKYMIS